LPGVSPAARIARGDVFECTVQNGGGYGDPILREPERVAADVESGAVTAEAAERIYGVVVRGGVADETATRDRRERIRASRRSRMTVPERPAHSTATGEPTGIWGASLTTRADGDSVVGACRHCGTVLGELGHGWESVAGRVRLDGNDLGAHVAVHDTLDVIAYVCPHCVTALWVDVEPSQGKTWRDFALRA